MEGPLMAVNEVAILMGVTARTLHYYDEIGLLVPKHYTKANYRLYTSEDVEYLQQIIFLKEIGFELKQITQILQSPDYDKIEIYKRQRALLYEKKKQMDRMIVRLDALVEDKEQEAMEGWTAGHDAEEVYGLQKQYYDEIERLYGGSESYHSFEKKSKEKGKKLIYAELDQAARTLFQQIGLRMDSQPDNEHVQELISKWQEYISANLYPCTNEILAGLGQLYVTDERFTAYFENIRPGLARYIAEAIKLYVAEH